MESGTVYLSEALRGEPVGLQPEDDRFWGICFGPPKIGLLDDHRPIVFRVTVEVSPMSSDEVLPMSQVAQRSQKRGG